jgi:hypothetical protein
MLRRILYRRYRTTGESFTAIYDRGSGTAHVSKAPSSRTTVNRTNKKGHGKPIRRLAMTSILKQNTRWCLALPLHSELSAWVRKAVHVDLSKFAGSSFFPSGDAKL